MTWIKKLSVQILATLREEVRHLAAREHQNLGSIAGVAVAVETSNDPCEKCGGPMNVLLQQDEQESGWKIAAHAAYILGKYERGAATKLAREARVSANYIRSLAATARTFPEAQRNHELTITHHRIAAQTGDPKVWLKRAAEKKWSVRELQEAIADRHVDDEYRSQVERLENTVRKFNETWGATRNIKAILVWESLKAASA
ncbi:MAG TPA: hypothetical protein VMW83_12735 [Spirochaetia bacterium]|nr:hypothetical protein [Spirochaetia bacterium]